MAESVFEDSGASDFEAPTKVPKAVGLNTSHSLLVLMVHYRSLRLYPRRRLVRQNLNLKQFPKSNRLF